MPGIYTTTFSMPGIYSYLILVDSNNTTSIDGMYYFHSVDEEVVALNILTTRIRPQCW